MGEFIEIPYAKKWAEKAIKLRSNNRAAGQASAEARKALKNNKSELTNVATSVTTNVLTDEPLNTEQIKPSLNLSTNGEPESQKIWNAVERILSRSDNYTELKPLLRNARALCLQDGIIKLSVPSPVIQNIALKHEKELVKALHKTNNLVSGLAVEIN